MVEPRANSAKNDQIKAKSFIKKINEEKKEREARMAEIKLMQQKKLDEQNQLMKKKEQEKEM